MSGQLVGEVIAAQTQLRALGVTKNGFLALIAIAEKASNGGREASVRWAHLQDGLYGASVKTARRAVKELEDLKLIRVVSKGWANQHDGRSRAPIYEVRKWTPVSISTNRIGTPVSTSTELDMDKSEVDVDKSELDVDTVVPLTSADVSLDGSFDGSIGGDARGREPTDQPDSRPPDWATPPLQCLKHPNGYEHGEPCRRCAALRKWDTKEAKAKRQDANYREAHNEWNRLHGEACSGMYGDWRPDKPPRFRSEFSSEAPWRQPIPPPEADDLSVNGIEQW